MTEDTSNSRMRRGRFDELLDDVEEAQALYRSVRDEVQRNLKMLGIEPRRKPNMARPRLEGQVSQMSDAELGDIQGEFAVWEDFLGEQAIDYATEAKAIKSERDYLLSRLKTNATGPVAGRADKAKGDIRYVRMDQQYLIANSVAKRLEQAHDGLKNQRQVCSRYVELRTREIDGSRRVDNVKSRRRGAPRFRDR